MHRTVAHFFPGFCNWLDGLRDGRNVEACTYPLRALVWTGLLMFLFQLRARRRLRYDLNSAFGLFNLNALAQSELASLPHPDTLGYALKKLAVHELAKLRRRMVGALLRGRVLERFRLLGQFYLIAVDGTGYLTFSEPHCPHCLSRRLPGGRLQYHHPVLEAKLVCSNGLVISVATEFIENSDGAGKQDCELRAFERLLPALRADFPRLPTCLLLDALYLNDPVLTFLKEHDCRYIITFKAGSLPEAYKEWEALWPLTPQQQLDAASGGFERRYRWVNALEHAGHRFDGLECVEVSPKGTKTRFLWVTDIGVNAGNAEELSEKGGRCRWKIENEGFNTQKNGGYGLEHAYAEDWTAARNFYLLMQIAHLIGQLLVKGALRRSLVARLFGSIQALAARLLEAWRTAFLEPDQIAEIITAPCQIRLDDS